MKKLIASLLIVTMFGVSTVSAKVYYTESSSLVLNEDGISQSKSIVSKPIGGTITFERFGEWPEGFTAEEGMFAGGIFDGGNLWLVPYNAPFIVSVSPEGEMSAVDMPQGYSATENAFYGGAFDGENIYLAPYRAAGIVKINKDTGVTEYIDTWPDDFDKSTTSFVGAVFDGEFIWFIPSGPSKIIRMDLDGNMSSYDSWPEETSLPNNTFWGGVLAGSSIYLVPGEADNVVVFDCKTGEMTTIQNWPEGFSKEGRSFAGGIFDGEYVYLIPNGVYPIIKISHNTKAMYSTAPLPEALPSNARFVGGAFDGRFIWCIPYMGKTIVKHDIYNNTNELYTIANSSDQEQYLSGAFGDNAIWLAPYSSMEVVRIDGDNTPPTVMNIFLSTTPNTPVSGEMTASDPDDEDIITFAIVSEPSMGQVSLDGETGVFTYTPNTDITGTDTFTFKANDSHSDSNIATATITIEEEAPIPKGRYIDLWDHWAEIPANELTDMDVFLGENVDGYFYFYPDYLMTRVGFMVLANSTFGFEGSMNDTTLPFTDIDPDLKWVVMAASAGWSGDMVHGFPVGDYVELRPFENLTRLEAMTMIHNVINPDSAEEVTLDYADSDTFPEWSIPILKALKNIGLLTGYDDNTVRPFNTVSRAEAVQILYAAVLYMNGTGQNLARLK